jgi:taurine dioxygenase
MTIPLDEAYDDLPEEAKRRIEHLRVVHRYDSSHKRGRVVTLAAAEVSTLPEVVHPLVRVHPESGRKGLYLNPNRMEGIVGMAQDEGDRLLDQLFEHATQPTYQYRHKWLDGDIVIWDDRCTMHKANPDIPAGERRLMHRMVPTKTRSPALASQGFSDLPLAVAASCHVSVTDAGVRLPASSWRCRWLHR